MYNEVDFPKASYVARRQFNIRDDLSHYVNVVATFLFNKAVILELGISRDNPTYDKYVHALRMIDAQLTFRFGIKDENVIELTTEAVKKLAQNHADKKFAALKKPYSEENLELGIFKVHGRAAYLRR